MYYTLDNRYSLQSSETATSRARLFLSYIGCNLTSSTESMICARATNITVLYDGYISLEDYIKNNQSKPVGDIFWPTIDNTVFKKSINDLAKENAFKKCNIITGYNSEEASSVLLSYYHILGNDYDWVSRLNSLPQYYLERAEEFNYEKFSTLLNLFYKYFPYYSELSSSALINRILNQYFSSTELQNPVSVSSAEYIRRLVRIVSDNQYVCQAYDVAGLYSKSGINAYVYKFQYRLPKSRIHDQIVKYFGTATHGDELDVLFWTGRNNRNDYYLRKISQDLFAYWTNFVKYDDPNGLGASNLTRWHPFLAAGTDRIENGRTIVFNNSGYSIQTGFSENKCDFWNTNTLPLSTSTRTSTSTSIIMFLVVTTVLLFSF